MTSYSAEAEKVLWREKTLKMSGWLVEVAFLLIMGEEGVLLLEDLLLKEGMFRKLGFLLVKSGDCGKENILALNGSCPERCLLLRVVKLFF